MQSVFYAREPGDVAGPSAGAAGADVIDADRRKSRQVCPRQRGYCRAAAGLSVAAKIAMLRHVAMMVRSEFVGLPRPQRPPRVDAFPMIPAPHKLTPKV
jgi:hypothetical protein